jgi:hypothetical protein
MMVLERYSKPQPPDPSEPTAPSFPLPDFFRNVGRDLMGPFEGREQQPPHLVGQGPDMVQDGAKLAVLGQPDSRGAELRPRGTPQLAQQGRTEAVSQRWNGQTHPWVLVGDVLEVGLKVCDIGKGIHATVSCDLSKKSSGRG